MWQFHADYIKSGVLAANLEWECAYNPNHSKPSLLDNAAISCNPAQPFNLLPNKGWFFIIIMQTFSHSSIGIRSLPICN